MAAFIPKIIITSGEPSGVGPDVCLSILNARLPARISVLGDPVVFGQRAKQLGLEGSLKQLDLISVPTASSVIAGRLDIKNVPMVLKQLDIAVLACVRKQFDAMVTAPVHKGIINDAGHSFSGHTEYLAQKTQSNKPVMMLSCDAMRVALMTTHLPLAEVPAAITQDSLIRVLEVLYNELKFRFGISSPTIAVCGLNPHAGEQGHLGRQELDIIAPTLQLARDSGMNILGPLPADTAFTPRILDEVDAVLTMYHDQGLPVLKYASFGRGTNITLGLPIIRTSVDHGTALDLAGSGRAESGSMRAAIESAIAMANVVHARRLRRKERSKMASTKTAATKASAVLSPRKASPKTEKVSNDLSETSFLEIFNPNFDQDSLTNEPVENKPVAQNKAIDKKLDKDLSDSTLHEMFNPNFDKENLFFDPGKNQSASASNTDSAESMPDFSDTGLMQNFNQSFVQNDPIPEPKANKRKMHSGNSRKKSAGDLTDKELLDLFYSDSNEEDSFLQPVSVKSSEQKEKKAKLKRKEKPIDFESTMTSHDIEDAVKSMRKLLT